MAHVIQNQGTALSIPARLREIASQSVAAYQNWRLFRITLNELSKLSTRELDDLGLSRSDLRCVALESAYGKNI